MRHGQRLHGLDAGIGEQAGPAARWLVQRSLHPVPPLAIHLLEDAVAHLALQRIDDQRAAAAEPEVRRAAGSWVALPAGSRLDELDDHIGIPGSKG